MKRNTNLSQFFTPTWAAELITRHYFPNLKPTDVVCEPACGDGRFLMALPEHVNAFGVEIDSDLAEEARTRTGRQIVTGSFLEATLPSKPTVILGNPPFKFDFLRGLLDRAYDEMDYGIHIGLILPCYMFQTANTLMDIRKQFSVRQDMLPRNLFQGMEKPLMFAQFIKEERTVLSGFFLYNELANVLNLQTEFRLLFIGNDSRASLWGEVVEKALLQLGGEASLEAIYLEVEGNKPFDNRFWRAQIRKVLQKDFVKTGPARYALHKKPAGQLSLFVA